MDARDYDEIEVQGELAKARHRILAGEYALGVGNLTLAASVDPTNADLEDLLDIVVDEVGKRAPQTVEFADPDRPTPGELAVQARFLCAAGRQEEAVAQLLPLIVSDPARGWSSWLARWLDDDPTIPLSSEAFLAAFGPVLESALQVDAAPRPGVSLADATVAAARAVATDPENGWLQSAASVLARRVGRVDDAVAWAAAGDRTEPTAFSASVLGYALRAAGDEDAAFEAFEAASGRAPSDVGHRLDAADSLAALGEWGQAATWAESAWRLDPQSGAAAARTLAARHRDTGEVRHALELFEWLEERVDEQGNAAEAVADGMVLADAVAGELPWSGHIPVPVNVAAGLLDDLRAAGEKQRRGRLPVTLPVPEAPTALVALRHAVGRDLAVAVTEIPEPDPRLPRRGVSTLSWALEEDRLVPAVASPTARALAAVRITPSRWYRLHLAARDGAQVAADVGTINELVALALHPQPGPDRFTPWEWVRRWQVVCCVALAERDALDVLCDLADGPEDWLCDAALAGLVHLAGRRADQRQRIVEFANAHLVGSFERMRAISVPYLGSECDLFDLLPGRPEDDAEAARALKQQWTEIVEGTTN